MEDIAKSIIVMLDRGIIDIEKSRVLYMQAFMTWIDDHEHLHQEQEDVN